MTFLSLPTLAPNGAEWIERGNEEEHHLTQRLLSHVDHVRCAGGLDAVDRVMRRWRTV